MTGRRGIRGAPAAMARILRRLPRALLSPPVLSPPLLAVGIWAGFLANARLWIDGITPPWSYDPGLGLAATLPAAVAHRLVWLSGRRSTAWLLLWTPGLALYFARPWNYGRGWEARGVLELVRPWTAALLRSPGDPPPDVLAALCVLAAMTALATGIAVRLWLAAVRDAAGGGGGTDRAEDDADALPHATWATAREVRRRFAHPGGIVLGEHLDPLADTPGFDPADPRTWRRQGSGRLITMDPAQGNGHVVVLAASAGFKTAGVVIPNILNYDGPLTVFDPKGDLHARTREAREAMGYTATVIDGDSGFDPFRLVAATAAESPSVHLTLARTLMPLQARGSDVSEYFHEMACNLFAALVAHCTEAGTVNVAATVSRFLNRPREEVLADAAALVSGGGPGFIEDELEGLGALDGRTFPGVVKTITNKLAFARFPDTAAYGSSTMSPAEHIAALGPRNDIFINMPALMARDFASFPRLLVGAMYVTLELTEQPDRPRARRLFLIDEARVLGGMEALANVRDAGRSIGMHLMLIYQSFGQLVEAWGGEAGATAWLDSCEARVVSAVGSSRTAADIVAMLGRRTLRTRMRGSSSSAPVMSPMGGSVGSSETEQLREVPLMSAAALGQLPAHGSVIFTRRTPPVLATKAVYFTRADMRGRVRSPDEVADRLAAVRRHRRMMRRLGGNAGQGAEPPEHPGGGGGSPPGPGTDGGTRGPTDPPQPMRTSQAGDRAGHGPGGTVPRTGGHGAAATPGTVDAADTEPAVTGDRSPTEGGGPDAGMEVTPTERLLVLALRRQEAWVLDSVLGMVGATRDPSAGTADTEPGNVPPSGPEGGMPGSRRPEEPDPRDAEPEAGDGMALASAAPEGTAEDRENTDGGPVPARTVTDGDVTARRPWTDDERRTIRTMRSGGRSWTEVAERLGRGVKAVRRQGERLARREEPTDVDTMETGGDGGTA